MKLNESDGTLQRSIKFFRNLQAVHPPVDAPAKLIRQCVKQAKPRTTAMLVSMQASGMKQIALAVKLQIGESYLSKLINGTHNETGELPGWFVPAFCWATGIRLLEQVIDHEQDEADDECARMVVRRMAEQLREAA